MISLALAGLLALALTFLGSMARSLLDGLSLVPVVLLFLLFLFGGRWLTNTSRRMRLVSAGELLSQDNRLPVLYLRSFQQDKTAAQVVATELPSTQGGPVVDVLLLSIRTEEEQIAEVFNEIGPFVAIGRPGEPLPEIGAARMYVGDDVWQATVADLMSRARLVVFRAANTEGFWWEVERAAAAVNPEKVIFLIPKDIDYDRFRQRAEGLLGRPLPTDAGPRLHRCGTLASVLYFQGDGRSQFLTPRTPWGRGRLRSPMVPVLKLMLKPVFDQLGVPWSPPPLRWGVWAACLSVFLIPILFLLVAGARRADQKGQAPLVGEEQPQPKLDPHKESLEKVVRAFLQCMASPQKEDQQAALKKLEYTDQDLETLFPNQEALRLGLQIARIGFLESAEPLADELKKRGTLRDMDVVDLRSEPRFPAYDRAIRALAPKIPIYATILDFESGKVGFHPFVLLNGRWIWLQGLDKFSKVIQ